MTSEEADEPSSIELPEDVASWLRGRAAERDVDLQTQVRELLAAQRALAVDDEAAPAPDALLTEREVEARLEDRVSDGIEDVRSDFRALLEDVRDRVVQVKRETDAKAPADHEHDALGALDERVQALADDVGEHGDRLDDVRADLDDGFENYEAVLDHLVETTDDLADRTDRLAASVDAAREELQAVARSVRDRDRVARLKREAALEGIDAAECESCGREVRTALLTEPRCPACEAAFRSVEPKRGLLGSATFHTGDEPALTGADESEDGTNATERAETAIADGSHRPGDVHWESTGDRT